MKKVLSRVFMMSAVVGMGFLGACSDDDDNGNGNGNGNGDEMKTIADVASENEDFSILVDALTRTNLVDAVSDANANLTVFAPTNDAFTSLLGDLGLNDLDDLESTLGAEALANILLYHVLGTKVMSSDVTTGYVTSLATNSNDNNLSMYISTSGGVSINGNSNVETPDIEASNGVIHAIDAVILPQTILGLVGPNNNFDALVTAASVADNNPAAILDDEASFMTLFAPTNDGFDQLISDLNATDLNDVVATVGTAGLFTVLAYHVVGADVRASDIEAGSVTTLAMQDFDISIDGSGNVIITDTDNRTATVTTTDITATNGTIHIIDNVILPTL